MEIRDRLTLSPQLCLKDPWGREILEDIRVVLMTDGRAFPDDLVVRDKMGLSGRDPGQDPQPQL